MCFLDIAKAFLSVRRDLFWSRLSAAVASDDLIRVRYTLYLVANGTVRASTGCGNTFYIHLGTREGGTESTLLYSLQVYVFDLVSPLGAVQLEVTRCSWMVFRFAQFISRMTSLCLPPMMRTWIARF